MITFKQFLSEVHGIDTKVDIPSWVDFEGESYVAHKSTADGMTYIHASDDRGTPHPDKKQVILPWKENTVDKYNIRQL